MPKRISKKLTDTNQIAAAVLNLATKEDSFIEDRSTISRIMAEMGRKGGKIGGKRRLETMSAEERSRIAKGAAKARWGKRKTK
jgi:hypothetical protein